MEIIRIPQVSLVDLTGRKIGVYSEDPDWWQQLKIKQRNKTHLAINSSQHLESEHDRRTSPEGIEMRNQSAGSQVRLIEDDSNSKLAKTSVFDDSSLDKENDFDKESDEIEDDVLNVIGETPLHIAIMYDDFNMIKYLIEKKGVNVNDRSIDGKFSGGFKSSKMTVKYIEDSKYESLAYYGEYPLCFAACFSSKEIYDYLIDNGADPNLKDSNGNTLLHVLVINNKLDMFMYASNHPIRKAHSNIKNAQELTPINLAAKLGREELFTKMLEINVMTFWQYSNIICSAYPLDGIDTVALDGSIEKNAALSFIVNGETESHLDMLKIGVIDRLLEDKWSTYIKKLFIRRLVVSVLHLLFLSIAVYTRQPDKDDLLRIPDSNTKEPANTWFRFISEIFVVLLCIYQLGLQVKEIYGQGFKEYLLNLYGEPANVLYLLFNVLIILAMPFRFIRTDVARNIEDNLVILAIPLGWLHLLLYFRVLKITGPFVVMIYKMIVGDILTFCTIYIVLLVGFSTAFYYLYKNISKDNETMQTWLEAIMITFQMTLGEFKARLQEFDEIYYNIFTKITFMLFMIMMHILLLNMLIAMMGNTYHKIISKSEKEYKKQWAHIVILLERSFSPDQLKKFQNKYCIKLTSKDPNNPDTVALMVIKKISSTKATKKQNTIQYWKKFYKSVKELLKNSSYTSTQLLELWKNKEEINFLKVKRSKIKSGNNKRDESKPQNSTEKRTSLLQIPESPQELENSPVLEEPSAKEVKKDEVFQQSSTPQPIFVNEAVLLPVTDNNKGFFSDSEEKDLDLFSVPPTFRMFYPILNKKIYPENKSSSSVNSTFSNSSNYSDQRRPITIGLAKTNSDDYIKSNPLPTFQSNSVKNIPRKLNPINTDQSENNNQ